MTRPDDASATFAGSLDDHHVVTADAPSPTGVTPPPTTSPRRYDLGAELARGGLGRVQRAWDTSLEREVAVKTLLKPTPRAVARFDRETRITAHLEHPNIVPVHDGGRTPDGDPYLAMRLVRGRSLADAIGERKTLAERMGLLPHVIDACNAIAYAHEQRVAHRDIKPDNVLVGDFGETVVIDWGLAKDLDAEGTEELTEDGADAITSSATLTRVGTVMGTPSYMAPEQAAGRPIDERSDVYALGAVLYHTLAGIRPYQGSSDTLAAVNGGPPKALELIVPGVPRDLLAVTRKAMARAPADRYPDARSLAADLARFQAGAFVGVHHYTPGERIRRAAVNNPVATGLIGLLVVGTLVGMGLLGRASQVAEARRAEAEVARAEAVAVQQAERERLDELTVDQARWSLQSDPGRSLTLLDGLSADRPFDAEVRSIASEAWAASPPRRLHSAPSDRSHPEVYWSEQGVLVCSDHALVRFDPALTTRTVTETEAVARNCEAMDDGGLAWIGGGRVQFRWRGSELAFPLRGDGAGVDLHTHGEGVLWADSGTLTVFDGEVWTVPLEGVRRASFMSDGRVLAHLSGALALVDPAARRVIGVLQRPMTVYTLVASPFGPEAFVLGSTGEVERVRWDGGLRSDRVRTAGSWFDVGVWVAPGVAVVGGAGDELVEVDFRAGTSRRLASLASAPKALAGRANGELAVGTEQGAVDLVTWPAGEVRELGGTGRPVTALAWSPDGTGLLAGRRGEVHLWTTASREGAVVVRVPDVVVGGLEVAADGSMLLTTSDGVRVIAADGAMRTLVAGRLGVAARCGGWIWVSVAGALMAFDDGPDPRMSLPFDDAASRMVCSPDGRHLFMDRANIGVTRIDVATGEVSGLLGAPAIVNTTAFGPDGAVLIGGGDVRRMDTATGVPVPLVVEGGPPSLYVGWAGDVPTWVENNGRVRQLRGDTVVVREPSMAMPTGLISTPDQLVVPDGEGGVWFWTTPDGEGRARYEHRQYVHSIAMHPSGRWVATGGWDDLIVLWDLSHPRIPARILRGHRDAVMTLAWSPDGRTLYSGDRAGEVRAWSDPLATEPDALRLQVRAMADAVRQGRAMPDRAALDGSIPR